jgi:hypothetical protein
MRLTPRALTKSIIVKVPDVSALVRADENALQDAPHDVDGCFVSV